MAVLSSPLHLMLLLSLILGGEGYYDYYLDECIFSSDPEDVVYLFNCYFNRAMYLQFNSTVGKFVGFTTYGVKQADYFNSQTQYLQQMIAQRDSYCKHNDPIFISSILSKTVEPKVMLKSEQKVSGHHPAMLMCSAYDFYPPAISVSWLRDNTKVTTDVISTEEMEDGDWYYQVHSRLEYSPKSGEKISCVVEHSSLQKPIIKAWDGSDPSFPESERNKVAIGASGLVLGIVLSAAGLIYYYKKRTAGRILVPT